MDFEKIKTDISAGLPVSINPKGNSMYPRIKSGSQIILIKQDSYNIDDVVLCKVGGNHYVHIIKQLNDQKGYLIGNNKGHTNGWTKQIFAKAFISA